MNGSHPKNGFTFIELIIVMAVLGLIVGLVAPNYFRHLDESREVVLKNNLNIMRQAINDTPTTAFILHLERQLLKSVPSHRIRLPVPALHGK